MFYNKPIAINTMDSILHKTGLYINYGPWLNSKGWRIEDGEYDIKDDNKTGDENDEYVFISNTEIEEPLDGSLIEMSPPKPSKNDKK